MRQEAIAGAEGSTALPIAGKDAVLAVECASPIARSPASHMNVLHRLLLTTFGISVDTGLRLLPVCRFRVGSRLSALPPPLVAPQGGAAGAAHRRRVARTAAFRADRGRFGAVGAVTYIGAIRTGHTQMYFKLARHGWVWFAASVGLTIFLHDAYFYWTHRLMHHPRLFRWSTARTISRPTRRLGGLRLRPGGGGGAGVDLPARDRLDSHAPAGLRLLHGLADHLQRHGAHGI